MGEELYRRIKGHEKLTSYLGHWPSFNDGFVQSVFIEGATVVIKIFVDDARAETERRPFRAEVTLRWEDVERFDLSTSDVLHLVNGMGANDGYPHGFLWQVQFTETEALWMTRFIYEEGDFTACLRSGTVEVIDLVPVETVEEEAYREYKERASAKE